MGIKAVYSRDRDTRVVACANRMFQFQGRNKGKLSWFNRGPQTDRDEAMRNMGPTEQQAQPVIRTTE